MTLLTTIIAFVVALGALIVIHEFGHYAVARLCGVKVLRFSVGFGKPLWSRTMGRDGTEWVVTALPLGGYVKMLDEREGDVLPHELPRAFNRQTVGRRFAIVVAGPVANLLLAIALYWGLFVHGVPGVKPALGPPVAASPAELAGFREGEVLISIDGEAVITWQDARWMLLQRAVQRGIVDVSVSAGSGAVTNRKLDFGALSSADLDSDFMRAVGLTRFKLSGPPEIGRITPGSAAERAGFRTGDEIIAIGNQSVSSIDGAIRSIREHPGKPLLMEVRRGGAAIPAIVVTPDAQKDKDGTVVGRIGAVLQYSESAFAPYVTEVRYGPIESVAKAVAKTWETSVFSLKMLGKMVTGDVSLKNLSGPITIADYAGQSAQNGWISYLIFLALISISLGVLNLLPIPLLDGGHLMYYIAEIIKGSPVSDRVVEIGQHVGMTLLFVLMGFAIYNDINRLISG